MHPARLRALAFLGPAFAAGLCLLAMSPARAAAPDGWLERAQRELVEREYHASWQSGTPLGDLPAALQAPNREHGFTTYFTERGIRVVPSAAGAPAWEWSLALIGYGRGGVAWPLPGSAPSAAGQRVEHARGALVEWFVNEPRGLEQGFLLPAPPEEIARGGGLEPLPAATVPPVRGRERGARGAGAAVLDAADLIHLDLALEGSLSAMVSEDGQSIDFVTPEGARAIRYADLVVTDAGGRPLPAWMEGFNAGVVRGIRIVIDARDAHWPVSVDPLATSPVWTAEINVDNAEFGGAVASAGDVNGDGYSDVIVGAQFYGNGEFEEGGAWLYLGTASGPATTPAWHVEANVDEAWMGVSVATAGDVNGDGYSDVIVGAPGYLGAGTEGRAFVYLGSPAGLSVSPAWTADGPVPSAFGSSVASAGDVNGDGYSDVVIGAPVFGNGQATEGRAYVYLGSPSGLAAAPAWTAELNVAGAWFGNAVGTAGDVNGDGYSDIVIGALHHQNGQADEGRAVLFLGSATGPSAAPAWSVEADQTGAQLGTSVGTAGDVNGDGYSDIVVGAPFYDNGQTDEGRAFVYLGSAAGLVATAAWTAESNQASAFFGRSVATAGDVNGDGYADVIVGAWQYDNDQAGEGRGFVYYGSAAGLPPAASVTVEGNQIGALFGIAVATAGDANGDGYADVIVGANGYDNVEDTEGRAFVFLGSVALPAPTAAWTVTGAAAGDSFGNSVAPAGDVNGDGYGDVLVGAPSYDNDQVNEGRAYLYFGSPSGLSTTPSWTAEGDQADASFGLSVAAAGDVNGDGYADVIVGAPNFDNGESNEGRAYVYFGSSTGLAASPAWMAESNKAVAAFGVSVATAGDVNGDGYADIIIGAKRYTNDQGQEGRVFLYLGSNAGPGATPAWTAESNQDQSLFGHAVAAAGDVNGDGYDDVIVGAPEYDTQNGSPGRAAIFAGSPSGLGAAPLWQINGPALLGHFGYSVSTAGDVNRDGYADVVVGAYLYSNSQTQEGRAYLFLGAPLGPSTTAAWGFESDHDTSNLGVSVAAAGDVNGDGYSDVIVGAPLWEDVETDEGRAYLFLGSSTGLATAPAWTVEGNSAGALLGGSVASAGDVNGDGYADLVVGEDGYAALAGRALAWYGNAGGGLALRPQQRRADDGAPIATGLRSRTPGAFCLAALGRTPFGGGRIKMQYENKPRAGSFNGSGTVKGAAWSAVGVGGAALNELASGLEPDLYHWRMRLLPDHVTLPLAAPGRWLTAPVNGWLEADVRVASFIGGKVWEDRDGDGLRDAGEPGLPSVLVYLEDGALGPTDAVLTALDGSYRFELKGSGPSAVRVVVPTGYLPSPANQGADDMIDSDVDPVTGRTATLVAPYSTFDETGWSAGLRRIGPCIPPDETIFISGVRLGLNNATILDYQDPNQTQQVTGYNIYRTSNPALPHSSWTVMGTDVRDMDAGVVNLQWADDSGAQPPLGGAWYYDVRAYNAACAAEGP